MKRKRVNHLLISSLTEEEIQDRYGHGLNESQIMSLFPYEDGELSEEECKGYTVTYDPMTAYALRKTYPVLAWGKKRKNNRAFVFDKPRPAVVGF